MMTRSMVLAGALAVLGSCSSNAPREPTPLAGSDVTLDAEGLALLDEVVASLQDGVALPSSTGTTRTAAPGVAGANESAAVRSAALTFDLVTAMPLVATVALLAAGASLPAAAIVGSCVGVVEIIAAVALPFVAAYGASGATGDPQQDAAISETREAVFGDGTVPATAGELPAQVEQALPAVAPDGPLAIDVAASVCCEDGTQASSCPLRVASCVIPQTSQCIEEGSIYGPASYWVTAESCVGQFSLGPCPPNPKLVCGAADNAPDLWWTEYWYITEAEGAVCHAQ